MRKKFSDNFKAFIRIVNESEVSTYSGSASFFSVLSIFPIIILIANIIPLTNLSPDFLFKFMGDLFPKFIVDICRDIYFEFTSSRGVLISITAIMILWSAGNGVWSIMNGLNAINGVKERRNWLLVHAIAILYTLILIVLVLFATFFMLMGDKLHSAFDENFYDLNFLYTFFTKFRFLFVWIILTFIFMCMYRTLTAKKVRFIAQFPGALFASLFWSLISLLFSTYLEKFASTGIYGTFTITIFSMFWVYWSVFFIFLGAVFNTFFEKYYALRYKRKMEKKKAIKAFKKRQKLLKKGIELPEEEDEMSISPEGSSGRYE